MTPAEFARMPRVSEAVLSPDGAWLAVTVRRQDADGSRYVGDIWRVPVDGSPPTPLTDGDSNDHAPCFREDGALGFLSSRSPDEEKEERDQVWLLEDGALSMLTDAPLGVSAFAFSGQAIVMRQPVLPGVPADAQRAHQADRSKNGPSMLRYTRMPVRHWNHWRQPTRTHLVVQRGADCQDLTPEADGELFEAEWDVRAGKVVITASHQDTDRIDSTALWVFDVASGAREVIPMRPGTTFSAPRLSPDGRVIAAERHIREAGRHGHRRLCVLSLDGAERVLAERWDRWPTPVAWRGEEIIVAARTEGTTSLYAVDSTTGTHRPLSEGHCHMAVSVTGSTIVGLQHHLLMPHQPFVLPADGALRLLPVTAVPDLGVVVEEHRVESTDGVSVQGFILRPRDTTGPLPGLLWVHGGPVSHWADWWHWRWNAALFAAAGYVVALPNPRGSTGFGQAFVEGIWGNEWGGQCVADVHAFCDLLAAREDVDASRIGAMGASFGGYMMSWLGGTTDRFACIVCHAGIFDFRAFYGVTDYPAYWGYQFGCTPYSSPAAHERYSPINNLSNWQTPTLIIHGEKDYRCTIDQALGLFEGLQLHGVETELVVFPDEGHWITKPRNVSSWYAVCLDYVAEKLTT